VRKLKTIIKVNSRAQIMPERVPTLMQINPVDVPILFLDDLLYYPPIYFYISQVVCLRFPTKILHAFVFPPPFVAHSPPISSSFVQPPKIDW